jgi:MarR family transcriptional regulator, 2-MHQ and catechol-resistance regulon repressor
MSLETDINQRTFRNPQQKSMVNLIYTYHWVVERIKQFLSEEDITLQQYNILRILRGSSPKPLSTLQIRERMLDKMSDTSRIVDRLRLKGLVEKSTAKSDKRLVDVLISDKGRKLLEKLDAQNTKLDGIMQGLDEDEMKVFNDLLDKLRTK